MPKSKNKKCQAITRSGKKCNKLTYLNSKYCKQHFKKTIVQIQSTNKTSSAWYRTKNGKYFIAGSIIIPVILLAYSSLTGPSKENQEKLINKQDSTTVKINSLNYKIQNLAEFFHKPKNQEEYDVEKGKLEAKNRKLNELLEKLDSSNKINSDSLAVLKKEFYEYKKSLEQELAELKLGLKEIRKVNELNFKEIFRYGYTTFAIDAEKKLNIVEQFPGAERKIEVKWESLDLIINKNLITLKGGLIEYIKHPTFYSIDNNTFEFPRRLNDIGKFYKMPFINTGEFDVIYSILTDNSKGITFILGFVPPEKENDKQTRKSV